MNILYLKEFIVLAETQNFWEASERLYINQSTLSKHIKSMETELGVPLFIRTTRQVNLSKYGEALLPYAKSITRLEFEYSTLLLQIQNFEKGVLAIGSIPSMAQYNITRMIDVFKKQYPDSTIKIIEEDANNLMHLLYQKRCELIFTRESKTAFEKNFKEDINVVHIPYICDHMVVLLNKDHPLALKQSVTLRELKDESFCFIKEDSMMYSLCIDACQSANIIPEIAFTSHRLENIFDMVSTGRHIALLMNLHIPQYKNSSCCKTSWIPVDISPPICSQISLCYLKNAKLSAAARNFIKFYNDYIPFQRL